MTTKMKCKSGEGKSNIRAVWRDKVTQGTIQTVKEFVPRGQIVNKQLYQEVLARLRFGREVLFSALVWTLEM
jgi:hypothetical protein